MAAGGERSIGHVSQIPVGEGRNFEVGGEHVAVFRAWDGAVFATQAECPHRRGPLADGLTGDGVVICPLHDRTYRLSDGRGVNTECSIAVFPARVAEDGTILVVVRPGAGTG
jgi:nitrite reductase (NADH) small subunit